MPSADNQQERLEKTTFDVKQISPFLGGYIAGFVDGEGSFNISLRKKSDYRHHWQPVLSFNVSQKEKTMLKILQDTFHCGIIKQRRDGLYSYDVTNPLLLHQMILPFFLNFSFLSQRKQKNFLLFQKAVLLMLKKDHLNEKGLKELLQIRELINKGKGRTRKYAITDVFQESSETIRQATLQEWKI